MCISKPSAIFLIHTMQNQQLTGLTLLQKCKIDSEKPDGTEQEISANHIKLFSMQDTNYQYKGL